jgi:hypothetical protein
MSKLQVKIPGTIHRSLHNGSKAGRGTYHEPRDDRTPTHPGRIDTTGVQVGDAKAHTRKETGT